MQCYSSCMGCPEKEGKKVGTYDLQSQTQLKHLKKPELNDIKNVSEKLKKKIAKWCQNRITLLIVQGQIPLLVVSDYPLVAFNWYPWKRTFMHNRCNQTVTMVLKHRFEPSYHWVVLFSEPMRLCWFQVGSYTMAICAREASKPFYVLTESFKFVRLYPLNQRDLPPEFKFSSAYKGKLNGTFYRYFCEICPARRKIQRPGRAHYPPPTWVLPSYHIILLINYYTVTFTGFTSLLFPRRFRQRLQSSLALSTHFWRTDPYQKFQCPFPCHEFKTDL